MILGHIATLETEKLAYAKTLQRGLAYLKNTNFSKLENGRYEIEGDRMFALVQEYETKPKAEKRPETHAKYIDIQYIVEGQEVIGFGLVSPENEIAEDLRAQKDVVFYKSVENETDLILTKGMYGIFFPTDVHRPGCSYGGSTKVRKVVLKIATSLLP